MSITIKARDARLSILGYQPEVERLYWSHLPTNLPSYGQPLDLTGSEITAVYVNGEEAVVTDYCTFSPAEGATVPNEPTMTVTATYTARSGKIVKADALLPIANPSYIRIVVPIYIEAAKESGFYTRYNDEPTGIYWKDWFGWHDVKTYLFWTRNDEIVRITEIDPVYSLPASEYYNQVSATNSAFKLKHNVHEQTYDRYITPTTFWEVTCNAIPIFADYTIYDIDLHAETYLEVDYVESLELIAKPTACPTVGTVPVTLGLEHIKTNFISGGYIIGWKRPYQFAFPIYNPDFGETGETETITVGNQNFGTVTLLHPTFDHSPTWAYRFSCDEGRIYWTDPNDE